MARLQAWLAQVVTACSGTQIRPLFDGKHPGPQSDGGTESPFQTVCPEKISYAIERYVKETNRLNGVLDRRLSAQPHLAGPEYSIAEVASCPWIVPWQLQSQDLELFPALSRWFSSISARPVTVRACVHAEPSRSSPS